MAIVNPGFASAHIGENQDLFIISTTDYGATAYSSPGATVTVVFDAADETIGSEVAIDTDTGDITIQPNLTCSLTATVFLNQVPTINKWPSCQWYNVTDSVELGNAAPAGTPVTATITPAAETVVVLKLTNANGANWEYPAQITGGQVAAEIISGYTV